jgi:putative membrane protein
MVVKTLISSAVTGLLLTAAMSVAPAAAQQSEALQSDSSFIQMAGSVGLLQVKLGKMAEKKGSSAGVREFGQRMVADYSKVNEELKEAAKQAAFPRPALMRQHQQIVDRLIRKGGSSFDKSYMDEMVKQHGDEVKLYQQESESGRVQSLKHLASTRLPEVQQRLTLATRTARLVGTDATATGEEARRTSGGK